MSTALVWHRGDLRTHDHGALAAAAASGPALGVVVLDPAILDATSPRRRALFYAAVAALRASYRRLGGVLVVRSGDPAGVLPRLAREVGAVALFALRSHTPYGVVRDEAATTALAESGIGVGWYDGVHVHEPGTLLTQQQRPYTVYSPYSRRWLDTEPPAAVDPPARVMTPALPASFDVGEIPDEASDVTLPDVGEMPALRRLETFVGDALAHYAERRSSLDGSGGSRLSVDFTLGTLSARVARERVAARRGAGRGKWLGELAWRDFLADLLWHRPELQREPFDARWTEFEWNDDDAAFEAWRDGRTGIPVVDAAMRELRQTGWISNRARMVAAQFLTKHLRIDWRRGEQVFRHWLLDGDAASNVGNWQWCAGLGVDNAPYFRVFNPVSQGRQHDPQGEWLRAWAPESGGIPEPLPDAIVDLAQARRDYLAAAEETAKPRGSRLGRG
jgi:deoxyribodipyrimidine photo-lyase